ncbi:MAG: TIGR00153 family protein [Phycisphaerae bacterium]|nr:TIGR00153 family protein [Phycisphaerae bacterium]
MTLIKQLFGKTPFEPLVAHTKKVHECVKLVKPLVESLLKEDRDGLGRLQDKVSKLEYEADLIKHQIREDLPRRFFLPVAREDLEQFLHCQDSIADGAEDLAVILTLRKTKIHPELVAELNDFVDQVLQTNDSLMAAAEEMQNLAETSFGGAEAETVLERIKNLGKDEWKADRMQRKLSQHIYSIESELDPVTILFYEKILHALSSIANAAENTGDLLRRMILTG